MTLDMEGTYIQTWKVWKTIQMKYGSRSTEKMQMVSFYVVWVWARCAENVNKIHD